MVWRADDPQANEAAKVRWPIVRYTRGKGLDIGCGPFKAFQHFIGVDNCDHEQFGWKINPDVKSDADDLSMFASQGLDFVFSSHLLEHFDYKHVPDVLSEWTRVIKPGGYLILYLPDEDEYPKVGEEGANPDHKWNVSYDRVVECMKSLKRGWDMVEFEKRNKDSEYSLYFVFRMNSGSSFHFSWQKPKPEKTVALVRYGAFGDLMQTSSVARALKKEGYYVKFYTSPPGSNVIIHDPNIDELVLQDKDQVPNQELVNFWEYLKDTHDKFVNLSESVEGTLLALPGRTNHRWPKEIRHKYMNLNYVRFQHELAGVSHHEPVVRFYATNEEVEWARKERKKMTRGPIVMWSLAGSAVHKTWAGLDAVVARLLITYPECTVVMVGGPEAVVLEAGWENEKRVVRTSGKWNIRQSLTFIGQCDLVIGPETGVMNAASGMDLPKIVFLSHSTIENLTKDWVNTTSLFSSKTPCYPCHVLHYGWEHCNKHEESGTAQCQADISVDEVWDAVKNALENRERMVA